MSRILLTLSVLAAVALLPFGARADGLIHRLPQDSAWALYDLKVILNSDDQPIELTGTLRVASVGTSAEGGKTARWIEFRFDLIAPDKSEQTVILKVLVPEEHLQTGRSPVDHIVRGWRREGGGTPEPTDEINRGPLQLLLAGPGKDHRKLEVETIHNGRLGRIEAEGARGTIEYDEDGQRQSAEYEVRTHEQVPFGLVTMKLTIRSEQDAVRVNHTATLVLADMGDTALSDLPNQR